MPPTFLQMVFFLHANAKVASRCRHAANIAFDLFNIILYVIARKVRKCPLSPVVTNNVALSGLVRLADILVRLVQTTDSLSALLLTGALFTINWGTLCQTHLSPPFTPTPAPPPRPDLSSRIKHNGNSIDLNIWSISTLDTVEFEQNNMILLRKVNFAHMIPSPSLDRSYVRCS